MFGTIGDSFDADAVDQLDRVPLKLNLETIARLGDPSMKPSDRTKVDNCPPSTRTKVTAHCC